MRSSNVDWLALSSRAGRVLTGSYNRVDYLGILARCYRQSGRND